MSTNAFDYGNLGVKMENYLVLEKIYKDDVKPVFIDEGMVDGSTVGYVPAPDSTVVTYPMALEVMKYSGVPISFNSKSTGREFIVAKGFLATRNIQEILVLTCVHEGKVKVYVERRLLISSTDQNHTLFRTLAFNYLGSLKEMDEVYFVPNVHDLFVQRLTAPTFASLKKKTEFNKEITNDVFEDLKKEFE